MNSTEGCGGAVMDAGASSPQSGVVTPLKSGRFSRLSRHTQAGISPQKEPEAAGSHPGPAAAYACSSEERERVPPFGYITKPTRRRALQRDDPARLCSVNQMNDNEPVQNALVSADVNGAKQAMAMWQKLKSDVLSNEDVLMIQGKSFIKRSGYRKIALAFNLSTEVLKTFPICENGRIIGYTVEARATAPNGRYATDTASCEMDELQGDRTHHNCLTRATTRSISRAISDLVGGGEVSAEEMETQHTLVPGNRLPDVQQPEQRFISPKQISYIHSLARQIASKDKGFDVHHFAAEKFGIPLITDTADGKQTVDMNRLSADNARLLIDELKSRCQN